jgi:hypothetical protein
VAGCSPLVGPWADRSITNKRQTRGPVWLHVRPFGPASALAVTE